METFITVYLGEKCKLENQVITHNFVSTHKNKNRKEKTTKF